MERMNVKAKGTARRPAPTLSTRLAHAARVAISGDFNNWDRDGIPLQKNGQGEWCVTFKLRPGEYQYRLLVDGEWHDHPEAARRVPNPFGTENCVLTIP